MGGGAQAEDATVKQQDLVKINYVAIHNLEAELQKYAYHATKQAKVITNLQEQSEEKAALVAANAAKYLKVYCHYYCDSSQYGMG